MSSQIVMILRGTCLLLAGIVGWQVYGRVTAPEPLHRFADVILAQEEKVEEEEKVASDVETPEVEAPNTAADSTKPGDASDGSKPPKEQKAGPEESKKEKETRGGKEKKANANPAPPFPARFEVVATSGLLGKAPKVKPPPPALLGVIGKYAMIRAPNGKEDLVAEGGEFGGVKVIKISTNRVLIEHEGQQRELTIYAGMGSSSLLSPKTSLPSPKKGASSEKPARAEASKPAAPSGGEKKKKKN